MYKITVASGKGGTGKTTVATNLAYFLSDSRRVQYLDCDVEEPDGHIFIKPDFSKREQATILIPQVNNELCVGCGKCSKNCQYGALATIKGKTLVFPELCHSCGLCAKICPTKAITEVEREIGYIESGIGENGIEFVRGLLNIGESTVPPLISKVIDKSNPNTIQVIDAPPGAACPTIECMKHADVIIMVTEPTPFGLHDLKAAISIALDFNKPTALVINRAGRENKELDDFIKEKNIPILTEIPNDMDIARNYSRGNLILKSLPAYRQNFIRISTGIEELLSKGGKK
jgi:MinD superfamily P-loop ATPase